MEGADHKVGDWYWRAHTHLVSLQTVKDTFLEIHYFSIIIFDFTPISNVETSFFP